VWVIERTSQSWRPSAPRNRFASGELQTVAAPSSVRQEHIPALAAPSCWRWAVLHQARSSAFRLPARLRAYPERAAFLAPQGQAPFLAYQQLVPCQANRVALWMAEPQELQDRLLGRRMSRRWPGPREANSPLAARSAASEFRGQDHPERQEHGARRAATSLLAHPKALPLHAIPEAWGDHN